MYVWDAGGRARVSERTVLPKVRPKHKVKRKLRCHVHYNPLLLLLLLASCPAAAASLFAFSPVLWETCRPRVFAGSSAVALSSLYTRMGPGEYIELIVWVI